MIPPDKIERMRLLSARLERMSVDSHWARRAGGLRGNLLHCLEELEDPARAAAVSDARVEALLERGFELLKRAAREIPDPRRYP